MAHLFDPLWIRDLRLKNRVVISPMCQHSADEHGRATAWHQVHLGRFALGGAGLILTESTAVDPRARIGKRDLGLWDDGQIAGLAAIVDFVHSEGSAIGVQLAHAGRKSGSHALWDGGHPLSEHELVDAMPPFARMGPGADPAGPGWSEPDEMGEPQMQEAMAMFVAAAERANAANFDVAELHFGHGYLLASFLSPVSNRRGDRYGGSIENRMRYPLEVAEAVRAAWPAEKPLFVRISAVDGAEGGWSIEDSILFARELKRVGVDVVDCSSGGLSEQTRAANVPRGLGFQVPFAAAVRRGADIATQAVGVILDGEQANAIIARGDADLVAIGRQALLEPNWANRAALDLLGDEAGFDRWPVQHGSWLAKRAPMLRGLLSASTETPRAMAARTTSH